MTGAAHDPALQVIGQAWRRAHRRQAALCWALLAPWVIVASVVAARVGGWDAATVALALGLLGTAGLATWRARRLHQRWLIRQLDVLPEARDSAGLLFADPATLGTLQQLHRARVAQALQQRPPHLAQPWPTRALLANSLLGLVVIALVVGWPATAPQAPAPSTAARVPGSTSSAPGLHSARLDIRAPAYTGQPLQQQTELDAKVAIDSQLAWSLRFSTAPASAVLQFHDGQRLPLHRDGDSWRAQGRATRSALYRVVTEPALANSRLYRLEAVPDQPPTVRVIEPEASLVIGQPGQSHWRLQFEASDDHGVAAQATLQVTLAEGSGENITSREQSIVLQGSGTPKLRRFSHVLDLGALSAAPGNDVIVQLQVRDNHQPRPQAGHSSSLILRLPSAQAVLEAELEGMVKRTLPAYFRSQRQIILDAEALIAQRGRLSAEAFMQRADAIGVDQRILRLRYGQFLGEESEGAARPPPTSDLPTNDAPAHDHQDDHGDHGAEDNHATPAPQASPVHDHDHGGTGTGDAMPVFGSSGDVLSEYGHTHDHAEAATLLDPQTRATLKAALDQMWSSEGELRQGRPRQALPHAYKALGFIKEVQQAERIYLARVGTELPPIDESRRLRGDRAGISSRVLALPAVATADDAVLSQAWTQLEQRGAVPDLAALVQWQRAHAAQLADPLGFAASVDELQAAPDCDSCRAALRAHLWRALQRPVPAPARRPAADAMGRRYLDALEAGR